MTSAMPLAKTMFNPHAKRRKNKYNATVTYVGNLRFHSKAEAERWIELCDHEQRGLITGLRRQIPFKLYAWAPDGGKVEIGTYKADYAYRDLKTNEEVVEDKKGKRTAHFARTAKIMLANYGIKIKET